MDCYGLKLFADCEAERLTKETGKRHVARLLPNLWQWRVVRVLTVG